MSHQYRKRLIYSVLYLFTGLVFAMLLCLSTYLAKTTSAVYQLTPTSVPPNAPVADWISLMTPEENCELPCWWDIRPGTTTLSEVETILSSKFLDIEVKREVRGGNREQIIGDDFSMFVNTINPDVLPLTIYIPGDTSNIVDFILVSLPEQLRFGTLPNAAWEHFEIENMLLTYGTPDLIRLVAIQTDTGLYAPSLILYWNEIGVVADYEYLLAERVGGASVLNSPICFNLDNLAYLNIWMQSPTSNRTLIELSSNFIGGTRELSEISNLTNQQFSQMLLDNNGCLPSSLPVEWDHLVCNFSPLNVPELITAIQTANGTPDLDTICLAQNGMYSFTSVNNNRNALPRISSDIKIVGNGATLTRSPSAPQFRFFEVRSTGNLTLQNLTFTNGSLGVDDDGGAIFNLGTLTVNSVTFLNNQAGVGGAIASEDGQVTVTDSTFTNNASTGDGGAIHSEADLLIETSTFTGNTADDAGAVNNDGGNLTVMDSTFSDNSADDGGAIYNDAGILTLSGSTFTNNSGDAGGALDNLDGQAQIDSSTFIGNSASDGGAIRNYGGTITLTMSIFTGNTATDDGGALNNSGGTLTITDTRLENNTATTRGGAIYSNSSGTMSAHNSCISGNSATAVYAASTGLQDFTGNWWAAANGPGGAGPGSGDTVNSKINHANFLTAGCPLP